MVSVETTGALRDGRAGEDALLAPALSDAHIHLFAAATAKTRLDLAEDPPKTVAGLLDRVGAYAKGQPAACWVRVRGHDESRLDEGRHPTAEELDGAAGGRPVRIRHATLHASILSVAALDRIPGDLARLGRAGHGLIVGREEALSSACGDRKDEELEHGLDALGRELLDAGITAVDDTTATNDPVRVRRLAAAVRSGVLRQRVRVWMREADELVSAKEAANGAVEIAGVKLLPTCGEQTREVGFRAAIERARRRGLPVAIHAVDPDVIDGALDALASAPPRAAQGAGPDRLEHCSLCPPHLVERVAAANVAVVTQPGFLVRRGGKYRREVEEPLWPWLYPIRSWKAAGVLVVGSSDAPVIRADPRLGFRGAMTRRSSEGTTFGAAESISEVAALDLYTSSAAAVRGEADAGLPWLRVGARADFVVLDRNCWRLEQWQPRTTIIAGEPHEVCV